MTLPAAVGGLVAKWRKRADAMNANYAEGERRCADELEATLSALTAEAGKGEVTDELVEIACSAYHGTAWEKCITEDHKKTARSKMRRALEVTTQKPGAINRYFKAPESLHPATATLVAKFANALADKLAKAELKYGYSDGWAAPDWMDECRAKLMEHVAKGDPRDVAAYCAFLWHHNERTSLGHYEPMAWTTQNSLDMLLDPECGVGMMHRLRTDYINVPVYLALSTATPAGEWVLVPRKMTEEMRTALSVAVLNDMSTDDCWFNLLAASSRGASTGDE